MKRIFRMTALLLPLLLGLCSCGSGSPEETSPETAGVTEPVTVPVTEPGTEAEAERSPDVYSGKGSGVINVADYVPTDGKTDVSPIIEKLIAENPRRTLWFPDGTYMLASPIRTPAIPTKSVDLVLSDYAILVPAKSWKGGPLVMLGGIEPFNNIETPGSNYSLTGGIIDCKGIADGVSIESGRETKIRLTSIKNARTGLIIRCGANSGSSDADISDVNIVGTGKPDSVGILCEAHDNTFTNMRIGKVHIGVQMRGAGNVLRNIHPLYYADWNEYETSTGFLDESGDNLYDYCYSDQFAIGFRTTVSRASIYRDCFCFWWTERGGTQTVFHADQQFRSIVSGLRVGFKSGAKNSLLNVTKMGGDGVLRDVCADVSRVTSRTYETYLDGPVHAR